MEVGETWNSSTLIDEWPPPFPTIKTTSEPIGGSLNYPGLFLIIIPLITLLGNLLVIMSVLKFRALQSAINFLILGLAVADLLVAITVMPYAVYLYITNGDWYLGNLMCDIYMAFDVGCSTASILLLAVISFDRYRAVSLPIQYSRQSQNVRRVFAVIAAIWFISLALASPMVFGVNVRPSDANPYECRFYNAEFSILSSMISFVIPCFLVLFVYIRIIIALKKREKAAKLRREKNSLAQGGGSKSDGTNDPVDDEAAGRIVAGPVVNVMMAALPSMTRRMRQFERHRRAIELAGDDWEEEEEEEEEYDEDDDIDECCDAGVIDEYHADQGQGAVEASAPRTTSMLRRFINVASSAASSSVETSTTTMINMILPLSKKRRLSYRNDNHNHHSIIIEQKSNSISIPNVHQQFSGFSSTCSCSNPTMACHNQLRNTSDHTPPTSLPLLLQEREFGNSSTPRSSTDSLSDNVQVVTNDFVSENCTTVSRRSSFADESQPTSSQGSSGDGKNCVKNQKKFRNLSRNYSTKHNKKTVKLMRSNSASRVGAIQQTDDALIPSIIRTISRKSPKIFRREKPTPSIIMANPITESPKEYRKSSTQLRNTNSQTETETISASKDIHPTTMSKSTTVNSAELLNSPEIGEHDPPLITESVLAELRENLESHVKISEAQPTVSFAMTVREMEGNALNCLKGGENSRRVSTVEAPLAIKILTRPSLPNLDLTRMDSVGTTCSIKTRADSLKSVDSKESKTSKRSKKQSKNGIAVKLVKKAIKHEHSLKRKVSKAQRKEKRATKTLGVVVGVFLVCWVPFFVINIQNAVCILIEKEFCQVGYDLFFYCTWIGYMNSFMNPIIYTIFNTEFRRAFKSIIFGRHHNRSHHFSNKQAHV